MLTAASRSSTRAPTLPGGGWSGDSAFSADGMRAPKIAAARTADARMELLVAAADISINAQEYYDDMRAALGR